MLWQAMAVHSSPIGAVAGTDGLILTAGADGTVRSWDAVTGAPAGFVVEADAVLLAVAGGLVICASRRDVRRFDLDGREVGEPWRSPSAFVPVGPTVLAVTTWDGRVVVVAGTAGELCWWDAVTGETMGSRRTGRLLALTAQDRTIATSTEKGDVQQWDAVTGEPVGSPLTGHERPIVALLTVGGVLYGQEFLGPIHRWDRATGEALGALATRAEGMVEGGLAADGDGRVLISVDQSGTVWRWDLTVPEPRAELVGADQDTAPAVVPSEAGPIVVTGTKRWGLDGRPVGDDLAGHTAAVQHLAAIGDSVLISVGRDRTRFFDAATGEPVGDPDAPFRSGVTLAGVRLPDERLIVAIGDDESIERYDVRRGRYLKGARTGATVWTVTSGVWPDGRPFFAAGTADGRVHLVDARTGTRMRRPWPVSDQDVLAVAVTTLSDGSLLLATGGHDRRITCWNAVTGERLGPSWVAGEYSVMELHFRTLSDGRVVLASIDDDGRFLHWDALPGEPSAEPPPTDESLFAHSHEDVVRCWDLGSGRLVTEIPGASAAVVTTLPDGRRVLAVGRRDGSLTVTMPGTS